MNLKIWHAPFAESDLGRFNPDGLQRVKAAVELARLRRTLGTTLADIDAANSAAAIALEVKNSEQRVAMARFEGEREACYKVIKTIEKQLSRVGSERHREFEGRLSHLVTLFGVKDFDRLQRESADLEAALDREAVQRHPPPQIGSGVIGESASSSFYRGRELERAGCREKAVDAYEAALRRDPGHLQAKIALKRLAHHPLSSTSHWMH